METFHGTRTTAIALRAAYSWPRGNTISNPRAHEPFRLNSFLAAARRGHAIRGTASCSPAEPWRGTQGHARDLSISTVITSRVRASTANRSCAEPALGEVAYPHCISSFNRAGKRFADESYFGEVAPSCASSMYGATAPSTCLVPIFDSQYWGKIRSPASPTRKVSRRMAGQRRHGLGHWPSELGVCKRWIDRDCRGFNGFAPQAR